MAVLSTSFDDFDEAMPVSSIGPSCQLSDRCRRQRHREFDVDEYMSPTTGVTPTTGVPWGAVLLSDKERNGSDPDLRAPVVPVDFIYSRSVIRRLSVDETRSRNSQMLACLAILRDELRFDWSYGEIGLIFAVDKGIVHRGFLCHL
jgi:hypothetical protein